jgi:hydroxyacylglutathione hydrolase
MFAALRALLGHRVREIGPEELEGLLRGSSPPVVVDVRAWQEYAAARLPGAWHIPAAHLPQQAAALPSGRMLVLY